MKESRAGFVLMAALWLLVALAAVGLDAAIRHKARRLASANLLDETRLRSASFAGAEYARSRLTSAMLGRADELRAEATRQARADQRSRERRGLPQSRSARRPGLTTMFRGSDPGADPWRDPSQLVPPTLEWNGIRLQLQLRDPGAGLNINGADEIMFQQFFSQGLRLDYALAGEITAAIMDWRDGDDLPRVNGGESEQYMKDGAAMLPGNHAFSTIDELRFVKGMTDEIFAAARPFLSIRSNGTTINVNSAPEEVLLALPGMNREGAAAIIRQRRAGIYPRSLADVMAILPASTVRSIEALAGPGGSGRSPFARSLIYATDQVEVVVEANMPGIPVRAVTEIVVDRALNGAVVTWRRVD